MNINYKQSQFELFPGTTSGAHHGARPVFLFSGITLSLENLIISSIFILMAVVLSFSVGVERGKKLLLKTSAVTVRREAVVSPSHDFPSPAKTQAITNTTKAAVSGTLKGTLKKDEGTKETLPVAPKKEEIIDLAYTVQVASFQKDEYAQKEAMTLKKKGYDIFVVAKGKYSIVCVGKFSRRDEAKVILSRLKKTYKDCMVRRL